MTTNQNKSFAKINMRDTLVTFQFLGSNKALNVNFHFSYYMFIKSVEIFSCYCNDSKMAMAFMKR